MTTTDVASSRELTPQEIDHVSGGTPSIPIPPPSQLISLRSASFVKLSRALPPSPC
ncbi:MAG: hypothetical protein IT537_07690 [Hyphomicrobiales bacterium]|nr:hypothetical protein [Hyphomicrobiales bacterium]